MSYEGSISTEKFIIREGLEELVLGNDKLFSSRKPVANKFSWIGNPLLADVSDQGPYKTCVAHSLARAAETIRRKNGLEQNILDAEQFHQCIFGMSCSSAITDIVGAIEKFCAEGAPAKTNAFQPHGACPNPAHPRFGCTGAQQFFDPSLAKRALQEFAPVVAIMNCENRFFDIRNFEIYRDSGQVRPAYHAILVVGFDDENDCWEVQNSFGRSWGKLGRGRVAYGHASLFSGPDYPAFLLY
jgi:C1A family cysteine protease